MSGTCETIHVKYPPPCRRQARSGVIANASCSPGSLWIGLLGPGLLTCIPAVCFILFKGPRGSYSNRLAYHCVILFHRFFYTGPATLQKPTLGPTGSQSGAKVTSKVTPNDLQSEIGSLPFRKPCNLDF